MGVLLLITSVFTVLQLSIVLSLIQIAAWPLDFIGLRSLRQFITRIYAKSIGTSFMFWLEYMTGMKIIITGDHLPKNERVLVFSNHIAVEWMHLISLVSRNTTVAAFKAVMKESLKYVPIANCGIRESFVTVKRGGGKSARSGILESFKQQGVQLCKDRIPMWLIIFPEGTWITPNDLAVKEKANSFAIKSGFTELNNVLFPRANGFVALLEGMRHGPDAIDAVYDVTVAYDKPYHPVQIGTAFPPSVVQLCSASPLAPKEIHFHVTRHLIKNIPEKKEECAKWLCSRFAVEKEELLNQFDLSTPHTFPGKDQSTPLYLPTLLFHQSFLILHLIFFYIGMHRYCGTIPVLIFLGLGVVAALAAATGDKKKDKEIKPSKPVDTRKDK